MNGTLLRLIVAATVVLVSLATTAPAVADPITYTFTMSGSHSPMSYGNELEFMATEDASVTIKVRSYSSE